ncbi:MAG: hypothetical protein ACTS8A_03260 [Arsenophonus sp. ET-LJ4-MAG3]
MHKKTDVPMIKDVILACANDIVNFDLYRIADNYSNEQLLINS